MGLTVVFFHRVASMGVFFPSLESAHTHTSQRIGLLPSEMDVGRRRIVWG
jgi:hypothetical protein